MRQLLTKTAGAALLLGTALFLAAEPAAATGDWPPAPDDGRPADAQTRSTDVVGPDPPGQGCRPTCQ